MVFILISQGYFRLRPDLIPLGVRDRRGVEMVPAVVQLPVPGRIFIVFQQHGRRFQPTVQIAALQFCQGEDRVSGNPGLCRIVQDRVPAVAGSGQMTGFKDGFLRGDICFRGFFRWYFPGGCFLRR